MLTAARLPAALLPLMWFGRGTAGRGPTCNSHEGTRVKPGRYKVSSTGPQPSHRLHPSSCTRKRFAPTSQLRSTSHPRRAAPLPSASPQKAWLVKEALLVCRTALLIHKDMPCADTLVERAGWKDTYKQVPSALKIPAADALVLLTLHKVIYLFQIKGFPPLFVFGDSLGEHNRSQQTHSNLSVPFPKGYPISSK